MGQHRARTCHRGPGVGKGPSRATDPCDRDPCDRTPIDPLGDSGRTRNQAGDLEVGNTLVPAEAHSSPIATGGRNRYSDLVAAARSTAIATGGCNRCSDLAPGRVRRRARYRCWEGLGLMVGMHPVDLGKPSSNEGLSRWGIGP